MTIPDQLKLFFRRFGEPQGSSRITELEAIDRINEARLRLAREVKFYNVVDSNKDTGGVVTDGTLTDDGETYWTMRDDFLGFYDNVRDSVTYDGAPVILTTRENWKDIVSGNAEEIGIASDKRMGSLCGNVFYLYPAEEAGAVMAWWGYGVPPKLVGITGGDAYLTDEQATMTILDAVITAKDDTGNPVGEKIKEDLRDLKIEVKRRAAPPSVRLEPPPASYTEARDW